MSAVAFVPIDDDESETDSTPNVGTSSSGSVVQPPLSTTARPSELQRQIPQPPVAFQPPSGELAGSSDEEVKAAVGPRGTPSSGMMGSRLHSPAMFGPLVGFSSSTAVTSARAPMTASNALALAHADAARALTSRFVRSTRVLRRVAVIGPPETGKSSLINAFRQVIAANSKWPKAVVGKCGRYGTMTNAVFKNSIDDETHPASWSLMDTPGRSWREVEDTNSQDFFLLSGLCQGLAPDQRLGGRNCPTVDQLKPADGERIDQVVVVVRATDLLTEKRTLFVKRSYDQAPTCQPTVHLLMDLMDALRHCLNDRPAYVVLSHMDRFQDRPGAIVALRAILLRCVPSHNLFFVGMPLGNVATTAFSATKIANVPLLKGKQAHRSSDQNGEEQQRNARDGNLVEKNGRVADARHPDHRAPEVVGLSEVGGISLDSSSREALLVLHDALNTDILAARNNANKHEHGI